MYVFPSACRTAGLTQGTRLWSRRSRVHGLSHRPALTAAHEGYQKGHGGEAKPCRRLPDPKRMIGDAAPPGEFRYSAISVEQTPMPTHGAFKLPLPGLVIRFNEIDPIVLAAGCGQDLVHRLCLVDVGRQRPVSHASRARPA